MVDVEWSDFGLKRLFNPESHEFLPIEDQLKLYKTRDLHQSKVFATAKRIWGSTKVRNRVFIAPPMKDEVTKDVEVKLLSSPLKPAEAGQRERPREEPRILSEQEKRELHQKELDRRMEDYKKWLKYRMDIRNGLEDMGNQEKWLQSKPDLTALEQKVLERIIKRKMEKLEKSLDNQHDTIEDVPEHDNQIVASLVVPSGSSQPDLVHDLPEAIKVIGQHLSQRRLRIVDLFTQADKDKSWTITSRSLEIALKRLGSQFQMSSLMN